MEGLVKLNKDQITDQVNNDLVGRDSANIENLKKFYFKILTEPTIRTSSFRYVYAKVAFEVICDKTNDTDSVQSFNTFHKDKVNYEIANPIANNIVMPEKPKKPLSEQAQKFLGAIKTTAQFKM